MDNVNQDFTDDIKSFMVVNELLRVKIVDDKNPLTYYSRINDIIEGKLVIAWPTNGGIRLPVHRDQILEFSFMRDGVPYSFTGLIDETGLDPFPQITVILSSSVIRIQRRQNYRIKCLIPLEITGTIKENQRDETGSPLSLRTTTFNLSASGIAIRHPQMIPEGSLVDITLGLPDDRPAIQAPCRIIYSEEFAETSKIYRTGLHYLTLSECDRARIVRFVYRTQLKGLST
jgi:c-di-GMP-binding flagellar brake protein YcgR